MYLLAGNKVLRCFATAGHIMQLLETLTVKKKDLSCFDNSPKLNHLHQVDAVDFVQQLPPNSIDMLLTDPPYCSGGLHSAARARPTGEKYINTCTKTKYDDFDFDNMDQRSWLFWCRGWLAGAYRALKPGGIAVCFIDWRQLPALTDVIQAAGFTLRGIAVWDKTTGRARPRNGGFKQQAEFIVWASKGALPACNVYLPGVFQARLDFPKEAPNREAARCRPRNRKVGAGWRYGIGFVFWVWHFLAGGERSWLELVRVRVEPAHL